ncbi:MAG: SMI1/KNR4 family protein [Phycisphaerales bacterium]
MSKLTRPSYWIPLIEHELECLEAELRYRLPEQYRRWLIENNGGWVEPDGFAVPQSPFTQDDTINEFLGLYEKQGYQDIRTLIADMPWIARNNLFPIASAGSSSILGLDMRSESETVYMIDIADAGESNGLRQLIYVADSVDELIASLY